MAASDKGHLKAANGQDILLGGKPVVDPKSAEIIVPGLTPTTEDTPHANAFGESGDVFDHVLWRNILAVLWTFDTTRRYLLGLISMFCMRGKGIRLQHKGSAVMYNLPLPPVDNSERRKFASILGNGVAYPLTINFPRESSKVPAAALTMERFKCVTRAYTVPEMLKERRLTAVCASSGYEDMFKGFMMYWDQSEARNRATASKPEPFIGEEAIFWSKLITSGNPSFNIFNPAAIAAGSVSTKEVYDEDEVAIAGTIYWTGVNAMMTDAYNRIKASSASLDVKTRLENSAFYSDFKRKMAARNITVVHTKEYTDFLELISSAISRYLKRGSNMTAEENRILDSILQSARATTGTSVVNAGDKAKGIELEGTTFAAMRDSLVSAVASWVDE